MTSLIEYHNIDLSFGAISVLNGVQIRLEKHQCVLLTGRNGSGKSSLLKIMAGLLKPNQAAITYQGLSLPWRKAKSILRQDVIYLHQHPYLFEGSVIENLSYGLKRHGMDGPDIRRKVSEALEWAELDHLARRQAMTLSGGEKQRVALTRARILSPRLLLLDEPTASMDRESKQQTSFLLRRLKAEGISIVISSHEAHTIQAIADQHHALEAGQLVRQEETPKSSATASQTLQNPMDFPL